MASYGLYSCELDQIKTKYIRRIVWDIFEQNLISSLINFSCKLGLAIGTYDFLEIIRMILINIQTSPFLPKHTFGQTFFLIGPHNGLIWLPKQYRN